MRNINWCIFMKISGKYLADAILENLKENCSGAIHGTINNRAINRATTKPPTLAVILIGNDPASLSYIKQKQKAVEKIGAKIILKKLSPNITVINIIKIINIINQNPANHGLIVQRPLPPHLNSKDISQAVSPQKDTDGFNEKSDFTNPLALAILRVLHVIFILEQDSTLKQSIEKYQKTEDKDQLISLYKLLLRHSGLSRIQSASDSGVVALAPPQNDKNKNNFTLWLKSKNILILGRGETGGKPIANTLDKNNIKHIISHSKTSNTNDLLKQADIIISAVGKPNFITGSMIKKGAICLGVGISRQSIRHSGDEQSEQMTRLAGDFDESSIASKSSYYTPTPGGIGPINVACLMENLIKTRSSGR